MGRQINYLNSLKKNKSKKKEISLNKDSVLALMQEIYNELVEQRSTAIRIQNKMLALLKDAEDMTVIGPVIKEQQKIINDTIEKKLSLSKLQSTIWEKKYSVKEDNFNLSDMDDDILIMIIVLQKVKSKHIKLLMNLKTYNQFYPKKIQKPIRTHQKKT